MTDARKLSDEEALTKMAELSAAFDRALREAEKHADEYGLSFHIEPAYGMGGYYEGKGDREPDPRYDDGYGSRPEFGWQASSQSC